MCWSTLHIFTIIELDRSYIELIDEYMKMCFLSSGRHAERLLANNKLRALDKKC